MQAGGNRRAERARGDVTVRKPAGSRAQMIVGYALLLIVPFAIYFPALGGGFIWVDRTIYISENQLLREAIQKPCPVRR